MSQCECVCNVCVCVCCVGVVCMCVHAYMHVCVVSVCAHNHMKMIFVYYHIGGLERIGYYQPSVPYLNFIPKISPLAKRWNLHFFIVFTDTVNISLLYKQWPPFLQNGM